MRSCWPRIHSVPLGHSRADDRLFQQAPRSRGWAGWLPSGMAVEGSPVLARHGESFQDMPGVNGEGRPAREHHLRPHGPEHAAAGSCSHVSTSL